MATAAMGSRELQPLIKQAARAFGLPIFQVEESLSQPPHSDALAAFCSAGGPQKLLLYLQPAPENDDDSDDEPLVYVCTGETDRFVERGVLLVKTEPTALSAANLEGSVSVQVVLGSPVKSLLASLEHVYLPVLTASAPQWSGRLPEEHVAEFFNAAGKFVQGLSDAVHGGEQTFAPGALPHRAPSPRCAADLVRRVWHRCRGRREPRAPERQDRRHRRQGPGARARRAEPRPVRLLRDGRALVVRRRRGPARRPAAAAVHGAHPHRIPLAAPVLPCPRRTRAPVLTARVGARVGVEQVPESDAGPSTELEFWKGRMSKFNSVTDHLRSKEAKVVTGVLGAGAVRSAALRRWRQLETAITDASNECKDNVKVSAARLLTPSHAFSTRGT